jgi:hypothetical protein
LAALGLIASTAFAEESFEGKRKATSSTTVTPGAPRRP